MSFKTIEGSRGQAISIDNKNKTFTGYLLSQVDRYKSRTGKGDTIILHLQSLKGEVVRMFAGYSVRSAVLDDDNLVKKPFVNCLIRFTWQEKVSLGSGKTMNRVKIEVDMGKKAPKRKEVIPF